MFTKTFKVYGYDGHRQKISFGESEYWDFSCTDDLRIIEILRSDKTGTNDYVIIKITRNNQKECDSELWGQLSDGIFENARYGSIKVIDGDEEKEWHIMSLINEDGCREVFTQV